MSKILADTFNDIHKICLKESATSGLAPGSKISDIKQHWLDKR